MRKYILFGAVLFFSFLSIYPQGTIPDNLLYGAYIYADQYNNYDQIRDMGINAVFQKVRKDIPGQWQENLTLLSQFPFVYGANHFPPNSNYPGYHPEKVDWINHFTYAMYSKWEAEGDTSFTENIKVKHTKGELYNDGTTIGWKSNGHVPGGNEAGDSLVYGPHYYQYGVYGNSWTKINYTANFRLKMGIPQAPDVVPVCILQVLRGHHEYVPQNNSAKWIQDYVLAERVVTTAELSSSSYNTIQVNYQHPNTTPEYNPYVPYPGIKSPEYSDQEPQILSEKNVQYKIIWSGSAELYVDYVEVYDNLIYKQYFLEDPITIRNLCASYIASFNPTFMTKLKYWDTIDEPHSPDNYFAIREVQRILDELNTGQKLMSHFYPGWGLHRDLDPTFDRWLKLAQPKRLQYWFFPYIVEEDGSWTPDSKGLEGLRNSLQRASELTDTFYVALQVWGYIQPNQPDTSKYWWLRTPNPAQLNAEFMLAYAHGVKGTFFEPYYSQIGVNNHFDPPYIFIRGLVETGVYAKRDIWYKAQEIGNRLKGSLGHCLSKLNYSKDYIRLRFFNSPENMGPVNRLYLKLGYPATPIDSSNWHAGFLNHSLYSDDKYFMLCNLFTYSDQQLNITVSKPVDGFINYRFRDVEGSVDTTFVDHIFLNIFHQKGDGKLYQVAPVIKYGGKLIYSEATTPGISLHDKMIIDNGAVLTINGQYNAYADITIKNGRISCSGDSKINFHNGSKLIISGEAVIQGVLTHKLDLDFISPSNNSGILVEPDGRLSLSYSVVRNAAVGIHSSIEVNYFSINYTDFVDCGSHAVYITGVDNQEGIAPPIFKISNCSIHNCPTGIQASMLPDIVISSNIIYGTNCAISLFMVTNPHILSNTIAYGTEQMPGIMMESCNGRISGNGIGGHSIGILLGNSSPYLSYNRIYRNKYHGIYVGSGSYPNLQSVMLEAEAERYDVSGFNRIYENGGQEEEGSPEDNDGSEIYISESNIDLYRGCNEIFDSRPEEPPLVNTKLLMNGKGQTVEIRAEGNYWSTHPHYTLDQRFGELTVYYEPSLEEPCPPQVPEEGLLVKTIAGETVDTLYPAAPASGGVTQTELLYSSADADYLTGDFISAELIYNQIISGNDSLSVKLPAYRRLYELGKLTFKPETYFDNLYSSYTSLAVTAGDTLMRKIFTQLGSLSLVAKAEYLSAIEEFDEIVQNNPDTEEALYAEIDALTTALLLENDTTQLNKTAAAKYVKRTSADYLLSLDKLLNKYFNTTPKLKEIILPTEYLLYQNYPNPFNPVTRIRYDLPGISRVSCSVYDLLGRKVKDLVNDEIKQPGTYEVSFDASGLSSGVYFYRITANDYVAARKMIVVK